MILQSRPLISKRSKRTVQRLKRVQTARMIRRILRWFPCSERGLGGRGRAHACLARDLARFRDWLSGTQRTDTLKLINARTARSLASPITRITRVRGVDAAKMQRVSRTQRVEQNHNGWWWSFTRTDSRFNHITHKRAILPLFRSLSLSLFLSLSLSLSPFFFFARS